VDFRVKWTICLDAVKNLLSFLGLDSVVILVIIKGIGWIKLSEFVVLRLDHFIGQAHTQTVGIDDYLTRLEVSDKTFNVYRLLGECFRFSGSRQDFDVNQSCPVLTVVIYVDTEYASYGLVIQTTYVH
jgi:hypothetical protein